MENLALRVRQTGARSIGISGIDCAGKSTLADSLARELGGAVLVHGDAFTRPAAERHADPDEARGYYRDSFDYGFVYDELLPAVRRGFSGALTTRVSDWERDEWRKTTIHIPPDAVVIVEGCFLYTGREDAFDLRIWIDIPFDVALARALRRPRDLERMGGAAGVRERYATRYLPGQALHLERDDPVGRADIVL